MDGSYKTDDVAKFAADLRQLRLDARLSVRALERNAATADVPYSRTALAQATNGLRLPTLMLVRSYVAACGGDISGWERRWYALNDVSQPRPVAALPPAPPWPQEPVADGADPMSAGSSTDAVTVRSRRIAITGTRHVVGLVELRYSASTNAAWGRFQGYGGLDHLATHRHQVVVDVGIARDDRTPGERYRVEYSYDYHWSSLLMTGGRSLWAATDLYFDDELVAGGETDKVTLP